MNKWIVSKDRPFDLSLMTDKLDNRSRYRTDRILYDGKSWTPVINGIKSDMSFRSPEYAMAYVDDKLGIESECDTDECLRRIRINLIDSVVSHLNHTNFDTVYGNLLVLRSLIDDDSMDGMISDMDHLYNEYLIVSDDLVSKLEEIEV